MAINTNGIEGILYVDNAFNEDSVATLRLLITNNNPLPVEALNFQAAVTKVSLYWHFHVSFKSVRY